MKKYTILFTKQAVKDTRSLSKKQLKKLKEIIDEVLCVKPIIEKKLLGELERNFSYRLNLKDRIIYSIDKKKNIVYIKRCRTHYGQ